MAEATKTSTWTTRRIITVAVAAIFFLGAGYFTYNRVYAGTAVAVPEPWNGVPEPNTEDQQKVQELIKKANDAKVSELTAKEVDPMFAEDKAVATAASLNAKLKAANAKIVAHNKIEEQAEVKRWFWWNTPAHKHIPLVSKEDLGFELKEGQTVDQFYNGKFELDAAQAKDYLMVKHKVTLDADQLAEVQQVGENNFLSETNNTFTGARGKSAAASLVGAGAAGALGYFGTPLAMNKALGEEKVESPVVKSGDKDKTKTPETDKNGNPIVADDKKNDGKTEADDKKNDDKKEDPEVENPEETKPEDDSGIGGWAIFFIILACAAVIGGLVYFFFFMPKDEDEEFDAEAQDEQAEL